jgi:hypothetical protein
MIKQYMSSFCVSLVSDGFNIWNAIACLWPSDDSSNGGQSMRSMLTERLGSGLLTLIRPDSGEGVETLPQMMTLLHHALPEHWQKDLAPIQPVFPASDPRAAKYEEVLQKIRANIGMQGDANPFRRFASQQFRVLQGDGVALATVGDMLASVLANGFCANTTHFGSGGGLLQKLHRDSLGVAFKCCAMYVGDKMYAIGKDPIAGGKKVRPDQDGGKTRMSGAPPVMDRHRCQLRISCPTAVLTTHHVLSFPACSLPPFAPLLHRSRTLATRPSCAAPTGSSATAASTARTASWSARSPCPWRSSGTAPRTTSWCACSRTARW